MIWLPRIGRDTCLHAELFIDIVLLLKKAYKIQQKSLLSDDSDVTETYEKMCQVRDLIGTEGNDI
jgi:hypothetical protein